MSTLRATNIKNPDSGSNNIVLSEGGGVVISGVTTSSSFVGNVTGNVTGNITGNATGDFTISSGNLVVGSGYGIDFSATSNSGGMSSELFNDYETGTWTPSFQTTNNNATVGSTSVSHAVYTRIGNRVFGSARFYALITSRGTGNVQITGLPFTVPTSPGQGEVHCTIGFAIRFSTAAPVSAITESNTTRISLLTGNTDATTGGLYTAMPAANLSLENTNNIISISFNYQVA